MSPEAFESGMKLLLANWPREDFPKELSLIYAEALHDLHDTVWIAAARRAVQRHTFFPKPAELRDCAEQVLVQAGQLPVGPDAAWQDVMKLARRWHPGRSGRTGNRIIDEVIAAHGGIRGIALADDDRINHIERSFKREYQARREAEIEFGLIGQALQAPGHHNMAAIGAPGGDGRVGASDARKEAQGIS